MGSTIFITRVWITNRGLGPRDLELFESDRRGGLLRDLLPLCRHLGPEEGGEGETRARRGGGQKPADGFVVPCCFLGEDRRFFRGGEGGRGGFVWRFRGERSNFNAKNTVLDLHPSALMILLCASMMRASSDLTLHSRGRHPMR